jgi:hypothetical protein
MKEKLMDLLNGAVDIHIHAGPATEDRKQDMIDVARAGRGANMKAVVFKDHDTLTAGEASLVSKVVPGIGVFGGICLNYAVGGLNPRAVEIAIKFGAKVIYMPGLDSVRTIERVHVTKEANVIAESVPLKDPKEGLSIFKGGLDAHKILPEVRDILGLIAKADIILDTSHLSPRESFMLVEEAKKMGVNKIEINHPTNPIVGASLEEQKALASKGAYLNYTMGECLPTGFRVKPDYIADCIKAVGPEHCLMCSDAGNPEGPNPLDAFKMFITIMLNRGISKQEIELMIKENPAKLLGL